MGYGKVKRMMALVLACLCMVGQAAVPGTANAKGVGQPSQGMISKSKLAMYPNMAAQLKVTGVNAKVTWSSTDRRIATVMGSRGKNHQAAVIRTKDKAGTCKIKAKAAAGRKDSAPTSVIPGSLYRRRGDKHSMDKNGYKRQVW